MPVRSFGIKSVEAASTQLTKGTFKAAYEKREKPQGLVFHSDRGGNYISYTYREYLDSLNVTQSFSRPEVPYDNAVIEIVSRVYRKKGMQTLE